jgi:hypothetical protein
VISGTRLLALLGGLGTVIFMFELVRRREVREKYAVLWVILGIGIALVGAFPSLLDRLALAVGVESPPNLLFFVALLILLLVCVHLSWEVSRLEKETRALTEEIAVHRLEAELDTEITTPHPTEPRTPEGPPGAG